MPSPSSATAVAALPPGGDLYYPAAIALQNPGQIYGGELGAGGGVTPFKGQVMDAAAPELTFENDSSGQAAYTSEGQPILNASRATSGHVSEILNFHGSPAPWVLIGILLVAGILHLSAEGKLGVRGGV